MDSDRAFTAWGGSCKMEADGMRMNLVVQAQNCERRTVYDICNIGYICGDIRHYGAMDWCGDLRGTDADFDGGFKR